MIKIKREYIEITLGVIIFSLGFYFFLQPLDLVTGGIMGISVLITQVINMHNSTFIFIANMITLLLGLIVFGKQFFLRTIYAAILSPLILLVLDFFNTDIFFFINQIDDSSKLFVAAIVSGVLVGVGIGLVLRNNATTGGMDVIQRIVQKYFRVPYSWAVYITDGLIIVLGMIISFQNGIYGLISLVICAFAIEKTSIIGRNTYTVLIITGMSKEIKEAIFTKLDRGLTKISAVGGYSNEPKEIILSTMYRNELYDLKSIVHKIDKNAFTLILNTKEVLGEGFFKDHMS